MKRLLTFAAVALATAACGGSEFTDEGGGPLSEGGAGGSGGGQAAGAGGGSTGGSSTGTGGSSMGTGGSTGTGGASSGGAVGSGGSGGSSYEPCAGKPCGAQCSVCDPADPSCVGPAVVTLCDAAGECSATYPECVVPACSSAVDCEQPLAPCELCLDGSYACPTVDCVDGQCVGSFPTCQGTICVEDTDCPQSLAPCQLCPDGTSACPWSLCDNGVCISGVDSCTTTDPCLDKACGDSCHPCDGIPGCLGPPATMYCDANHTCQVGPPPLCGGTNACMSDSDCPGIGSCPICPDGISCAEPQCVSGACEFACPSSSALMWYATCGDPVCIEPAPASPYPACTTQTAGAPCDSEGAQCDTGGCGVTLLCSKTDPTMGGICPQ